MSACKRNTRKNKGIETIPKYGQRCLGKGIFVSNDTRKTGLNNNDLIIAGTGAGKTGSIIYTQLKTLNDSSMIVADTKNMLCRMVGDELRDKGYRVHVLDFVNPERSCIYNPLDYIRRNKDGSYNEMDIMKISQGLIPILSEEPFWEISARAILEFFIAYTLVAYPEENHDMYSVARLYRRFIRGRSGEMEFQNWVANHRDTFVANRYAQMRSMRIADKTWSSILSFVNIALYPFDVSGLRNIFDPNDIEDTPEDIFDCEIEVEEDKGVGPGFDDNPFEQDEETGPCNADSFREDIELPDENCTAERDRLDIATLGREKTVVFLNISDTDHSLDRLVNLFYTQAFQTLVAQADNNDNGQLQVPCRIVFDDFASGTVIPDFDKLISVIRSRDIWVTIAIQSLSQLESLYSPAQSLTIVNNVDHILYLGSNDLSSAQYIGTRAGKVPEEILAMDRTREYFIEGGRKAVLVDKIPPYSFSKEEIQL